MSSNRDWAIAFAKQSKADFAAYQELCKAKQLPICQQLHFLQMACEKLAKAYLYDNGPLPGNIQASHAHIAKHLPTALRETYIRLNGGLPNDRQFRHIRAVVREIELLAPTVESGGSRPDNCEYPWEDSKGKICVPAEYSFPGLDLATNPAGKILLKLLPLAMEAVIRSP